MKLSRYLFIILLLLLSMGGAFTAQAKESADTESAPQVTPETWHSFEVIFGVIAQSKKDLVELHEKMARATDDAEREKLRKEIELQAANIESLQLAWETWATGGVDMELFLPRKEEKFDWREELQSVFEPIVVELQRLTERPRKLERLRTEQAIYQQQFNAAASALKSIENYRQLAPSADLQNAFNDLENNWRKRHDSIHNRLSVVNLQINELTSTKEETGDTLKVLFIGSLINLVLAFLAAAITYGILRAVNRLYVRLVTRKELPRPFLTRAIHLSFILFTALLALLAAVAVLYLRGDRILLGLLLIALIGAALALQRTLPGYLKESKVLLNIGSVREGQRVMYNGLPWKVQTLNVYSSLINPALRGGKLMLPLKELTELISRPYDEEEPWFPTEENDFVLLDDQTYGRVALQTPETVQLRVRGAIQSYPVEAFLSSNPRNLSRDGFAVMLSFGVDYQHQALVTGEIRQELEDYLRSHLTQHTLGTHLKEMFVEFEEAAASSLNFLIFTSFSGEAAESYYRIRRLVQTLAVDACNAHDWVIPFGQMTVHLARQDD